MHFLENSRKILENAVYEYLSQYNIYHYNIYHNEYCIVNIVIIKQYSANCINSLKIINLGMIQNLIFVVDRSYPIFGCIYK